MLMKGDLTPPVLFTDGLTVDSPGVQPDVAEKVFPKCPVTLYFLTPSDVRFPFSPVPYTHIRNKVFNHYYNELL